MYKRLHGILSDVVVEAQSMEGIQDPQILEAEIRDILQDDLVGLTSTVHIPSMLSFQYRGQWITKQINLIGIDQETYADVSDFSRYLLHPENREKLSFRLRETGYDARMREAGWTYRRLRVAQEQFYRQQMEKFEQQEQELRQAADERAAPAPSSAEAPAEPTLPSSGPAHPSGPANLATADDPFAAVEAEPAGRDFDPALEQHIGIVLGIATSSIRHRTEDGEVVDVFLCRPGDDVKATFPTAGTPPQAVSANLTVVDFYESKMSEYDASFAFVPIEHLQYLRGMINPQTGVASVTSIQIKLKPGADLNAARDKLRESLSDRVVPLSDSDLERHARTAVGGRADGNDDLEHLVVLDHRRRRFRHPGHILHDCRRKDTRHRHAQGAWARRAAA